MSKKFIENMIPIEVKVNNEVTTWFVDVSRLNLSELINLKKELVGKSISSITSLDAIIHKMANTTYEENNFYKRINEKRKEGYRNSRVLMKIRRRNK